MNTDELFIDANQLPKPLSKSQTYELLDKVKQGDEEAKKIIAEHNIRLVLYEVTTRFKYVEYDKKDLVSIGNIGLIKAITTFDKSRKVEFSAYTARCIDNEILMFLRKIKKDQNVDSLNKQIKHDKEGRELKIEDIISDTSNIIEDYEKKITYKSIQEIIKKLPNRDKEIIILRFGFYNNEVHTQEEIANMMSISRSYVSRLIAKIVKGIGQELKKNGIIELRSQKNTPIRSNNNQYICYTQVDSFLSANNDDMTFEDEIVDKEQEIKGPTKIKIKQ